MRNHTPFLLLLLSGFIATTASAQTLTGQIIDETRIPLPGVNVAVAAQRLGNASDLNGRYTLRLPVGSYTVAYSSVGYGKQTRQVTLAAGQTVTLNITLKSSPLEVAGVVVSGTPTPTDALSTPQSVSVVEGRQLERERGQGIVQSIQNSPGVVSYSTGAGIAKPVIRGLTSQRVLVVTDGVRQEGQQWGDEHGPEIDALDVERVEVVRGPNSVLYGSDALGGVVNVIRPGIPSVGEGAPTLAGKALLNGFSNNEQVAGALALYGASGLIGYRGNVTVRRAGDVTTPDGKLFNSGSSQINGSASVGTKGLWGSLALDGGLFSQDIQIHEDPAENPTATPFQKVRHGRVHLHGDFPFKPLRLEVNSSWQKNSRREFGSADAVTPDLNLGLTTVDLDVLAHHKPIRTLFGTVGLSFLNQQSRTLAEEQLIPAFDLTNVAGYVYEERAFGPVEASLGGRYDGRWMDVQQNDALGVEAQKRTYGSATATGGVVWHLAQPLGLAFNLGRAWRAPTAFELFANGVHEGSGRFEIGDAGLVPEQSLNEDVSLRYATSRVQGELALFHNRINHYIYPSPTGQFDTTGANASNFPIYLNRQTDATLRGGEFQLQALVSNWLVLSGGFDLVRGTNSATDQPLPLLPADRIRLGARFTTTRVGRLTNPYASITSRIVARQGRVDPQEQPTAGYTLVDLGIGSDLIVGGNRLTVDLTVTNALDRAYHDHLSRYKLYALDPGRDITLKLSLPFIAAR